MSYDVGMKVYFQHPEHSWVSATITDASNGTYSCVGHVAGVAEFSERNLKTDALVNFVEGSEILVDDLLQLPYLHDSTLLDQVRRRYYGQTMFTYIGSILLSLNPFDSTIPRYQPVHMQRFFHGVDKAGDFSDIGPSLWALAQNTYENLRDGKGNQSVLVSGESGAGKTEAVKTVLRYLAATSSKGSNVAERILQTSPILESFGNAKTLRNDNSSRFGKFLKLFFAPEKNFEICGAVVETYLLEKSRIVTHAKDERGYHVFYQLITGQHPEKDRWRLKPEGGYKCLLGHEGVITSPLANDSEDFANLLKAMNIVGLTEKEQLASFDILASILHLQESVSFAEKHIPNEDPCATVNDPKVLETIEFLCKNLLGVHFESFLRELTTTTHQVRNESLTKRHSKAQAIDAKEGICKFLYEALFNWLVEKINHVTKPDSSYNPDSSTPWVGLLDIFGFEQFQTNSLEQLCINLANEAIQQFYNQKVFVADMEECKAEGIDISGISYADNGACVDLIAGKDGILALLDEECKLQQGTDQKFVQKVVDKHSKSPNFVRPRTEPTCFIVQHFAGGVKYDVTGFREKNIDFVKPAFVDIFRKSSSNTILKDIPTEVGKTTTTKTFRIQLAKLLATVGSTETHWVRTVKPHPSRKPRTFHGAEVMAQLRCSGVLDTVRIRKLGYAVRVPIGEFERIFRHIGGLSQIKNYSNDAQIGKTKVFMRFNVYSDLLKKRKAALVNSVAILQVYAHGRSSNWRLACQGRLPKLKMVQSQLRYNISRKNFRVLEGALMREVWLRAAQELAHLQNEETTRRDSTGREAELVQEAIVVAMKDDLSALEKVWWEKKPQRDADAIVNLMCVEVNARREVSEAEDMALVRILRDMREDFHCALQAQKMKIERIAAAVSGIQRQEEEERRRVLHDEIEEQKRVARLLSAAVQRQRRKMEREAKAEEDRVQRYLDTLRERSEALLVMKEGECGVMRSTPGRTNGPPSGMLYQVTPVKGERSPQFLYQTPTFSRLAGAANPMNLVPKEVASRAERTMPSELSASHSPSPGQYRTTPPGHSSPGTLPRPQMSLKADPNYTHSVGSVASLQKMTKRAAKNRGIPHAHPFFKDEK